MFFYEIGPVNAYDGLVNITKKEDFKNLSQAAFNFCIEATFFLLLKMSREQLKDLKTSYFHFGALPDNGDYQTKKYLLISFDNNGTGLIASEFEMPLE